MQLDNLPFFPLSHYFFDLPKENWLRYVPATLFARPQAFAAIRRRTQWIKRKKNGKVSENGADAPANKEKKQETPYREEKKVEGARKFEDIRLHMAKITTHYEKLLFHI